MDEGMMPVTRMDSLLARPMTNLRAKVAWRLEFRAHRQSGVATHCYLRAANKLRTFETLNCTYQETSDRCTAILLWLSLPRTQFHRIHRSGNVAAPQRYVGTLRL